MINVFVLSFSFSQNRQLSKAQKQYDKLFYIKSTKELLKLIENGDNSINVLQNLANAYYFNGRMEDASKWYKKLIDIHQDIDVENYFRYAQALKAQQIYEESDKIMKLFCEANPEDSRSKLFLSSLNYLDKIEKTSDDFKIKNLDINTPYSDFGTSFYNDGIYFASSKGEGEIYNWNEQPYLDIYRRNGQSNTYKILGDVNTRYHESSTSFSKDGQTMYFTRNNYYNGEFKKNSKNIHSLKIYKAQLVDGIWTNVKPLPFNDDEYNVAHPALNDDETKLYFASDMPGTLGGSDIFVVSINNDGTYGEPENLGEKINTEGRENFPFVSSEGTLYFSSDAHIGLGGLDVFGFKNIDDINNSKNVVYNIGKPINSSKDDFGYIINDETLEGYFSSNREGGKGDDDIYNFTRDTCKQLVEGKVIDKKTKELLANAKVVVYDDKLHAIQSLITNEKGGFNFDLNCDEKRYKIIASKDTYEDNQEAFSVDLNLKESISLKLSLKPQPKVAEVGTDLFKYLNLKPIYFDFDKSNIRPDAEVELAKLIYYMEEFPSVKVDVRSHTDSKGNDDYNLALSERRNKSTINFIIAQGISKDRLTGKGYGETRLVNQCANGVKCSKSEHQDNRRSEFIVVEN